MNQTPTSLLCLDLDGTVRHGKEELGHFVNELDDIIIFPEVVQLMKDWKRSGGRIIAVSNQGGIALGYLSMGQCSAMMQKTYELTDRLFDKVLWCHHHPLAKDPLMARCWCRKPSPGLIIEGALRLSLDYPNEFYPPYLGLMVGDREEDKECARLAGMDFMDAAEWRAQV